MVEYVKKYNPNRSADWNYGGSKWKLSRSKIDLFIECPRCFYLDNVLGTKRPSGPAFTLNVAVDALLKREFDAHRKAQSPHPLMEKYNIDAIPFSHDSLDVWRDAFSGIEHLHAPTGLLVSGAIDDVWVTPQNELIVIDYKATSKSTRIESIDDVSWGTQYARQISVYQWLLRMNGFSVSNTGYLVYANASADAKSFDATLSFEITLVPVQGDTSWIDGALHDIKSCLTSHDIPPTGADCEYCPYREASGKKLQAIHKRKNGK